MRSRYYLAWFLAVAGCKGDDKPASATSELPVAEAEELAETSDELMARRDALLARRREITEARAELSEKRAELAQAGADTADIDAKLADLLEREGQVERDQKDFDQIFDDHLAKQRALLASTLAQSGGDVAAREAGMAAREREMARREERIAAREQALAEREDAMAARWKESCAVVTPQTIVQTIDVKGSSYTKKDVEPLLSRARKEMGKKGILESDLPEQVRGLESEANAAMKEGDFGRARLAASQLLTTVRNQKIDKGFIAAKIGRLNQVIRKKKLSSDVQGRVDGLFREATASYGDGKFSAANRKLNQIYTAVR